MTQPNPIDFAKVESLRRHMGISSKEMASLMGVSSVSYYHWVRGRPLRKAHADHVKSVLRKLLALVTERQWPAEEAAKLPRSKRFQHLLALMQSS